MPLIDQWSFPSSSLVDFMIGSKYLSEDGVLSLFGSMSALTKLDSLILLTTPSLLALEQLSRLTALYVTLHDRENGVGNDDDTIGAALIHATSSLPSLIELEVDLNLRCFPARHVAVAASISSGIGDEHHIDYKGWVWSMTQLKHLSIDKFNGALPAIYAPQVTCLDITDWNPRRNARDVVITDQALALLDAKSQPDPVVDQLWRGCPSVVNLTVLASQDAPSGVMRRVISPPWLAYRSHSKLRISDFDCSSWFAGDIVNLVSAWQLLEKLELHVRHSTPATVVEVVLNECQKLESFIIQWYAGIGTIDDDSTASESRYIDAMGSGARSHPHLCQLSTTRFKASLLQYWSFPSLTSLSLGPSPHNNIDDLNAHLIPFLTQLPHLYRLSCQIKPSKESTKTPKLMASATIDDDSKRSSLAHINHRKTTTLSVPSSPSSSSITGSNNGAAPFVLKSVRTLVLSNDNVDFFEPIIRASSIGVNKITWFSITSSSLNRFIMLCSMSPMPQLHTLYLSDISFDGQMDTVMWQLLLETLPHLMTLVVPPAIVGKVRAIAKVMKPKPFVSIEPIGKDRAFGGDTNSDDDNDNENDD
jgi:hypothetical protein